MNIPSLSPRRGKDTLRVGDSDKLVVIEHFGNLPKGPVRLEEHGVLIYCTRGQAQFDYDGRKIELHKGDLFLYCVRCVLENMMASADFDCREIWFSRDTMWDINITGKKSLLDLVALKQYPKVILFKDEITLLEQYYQLLTRKMKEGSYMMHEDIVHTIFSSMFMELLCIFRRNYESVNDKVEGTAPIGMNTLHGKQLADRYVKLVEDCDGRIRKVDEFAKMLNVTPKYLTRQIKAALGRTPSEIIYLFTDKAIEYRLRFTDMTMQQIADDLHFANASFFGRYVKEHMGMTPLEYRNRYHNNKTE